MCAPPLVSVKAFLVFGGVSQNNWAVETQLKEESRRCNPFRGCRAGLRHFPLCLPPSQHRCAAYQRKESRVHQAYSRGQRTLFSQPLTEALLWMCVHCLPSHPHLTHRHTHTQSRRGWQFQDGVSEGTFNPSVNNCTLQDPPPKKKSKRRQATIFVRRSKH